MRRIESALSSIPPFLKWAGGKRWLAAEICSKAPQGYSRYIEPFLGGGAVFFALRPKRAIISDSNRELIEVYQAIKASGDEVWNRLEWHQKKHSASHYYRQRTVKCKSRAAEAARFIYLNRSCFNGLYRVNLKGIFNVPKGSKTKIVSSDDDFQSIAQCLRNASIRCSDFEKVLGEAKSGDFVFLDPPYTANHNFNGFIKYNEKLFSWSDQLRLRDAVVGAAENGAHIVLTNANHESLTEIYKGIGKHHAVERHSVLSAQSKYRKNTSELLIYIGA